MQNLSSQNRVLVVDDNRDAAEVLQMLLQLNDYDVRVAFDGKSGFEMAAEFRPQVICSDLNMPGISGFELASELRISEHSGNAYLIAITGLNTDDNYLQATNSGFDACLMKPFAIEKLLPLIRTGIESKLKD